MSENFSPKPPWPHQSGFEQGEKNDAWERWTLVIAVIGAIAGVAGVVRYLVFECSSIYPGFEVLGAAAFNLSTLARNVIVFLPSAGRLP